MQVRAFQQAPCAPGAVQGYLSIWAGAESVNPKVCLPHVQGQGSKALDEGRASAAGSFANISMNGSEVFKFAVRAVPTVSAPPQGPSPCRVHGQSLDGARTRISPDAAVAEGLSECQTECQTEYKSFFAD